MVALEYGALAEKKTQGLIADPLQRTSNLFNGLSPSNIWNWWKQLDALRAALMHETSGQQVQKNRLEKVVAFTSKAARKVSLHPGRGVVFLAAETELNACYKAHRKKREACERALVLGNDAEACAHALRRRRGR